MFYAPEMFDRKNSGSPIRGERTDIWALGVTMFFILTGRYPFDLKVSVLGLRDQVLNR